MLLSVVAAKMVSPPEAQRGQIGLARLSPDGRKLAYQRIVAPDATLEVASLDEHGEAMATRRWSLGSRRARALDWEPKSEALAVTLGAADPLDRHESVGLVHIEHPDLRELPGNASVWLPSGRALIVADVDNRLLSRCNVDGGEPEPLHQFRGDPTAPALALAPDGSVLAFTTERADRSVSEVWTLPLDVSGAARGAVELLTQVPGADALITPFFAPSDLTLGLLVVHPSWQRSAIIAMPNLVGEGQILYQADALDAPIRPAWSPAGGALFFFRAATSYGSELTTHELTELCPESLTLMSLESRVDGLALDGRPSQAVRFIDDGGLVVDGGGEATKLELAPV